MKFFIDLWNDPILIAYAQDHFRLREQDLFLHLIFEHPHLREKVEFVKQRMINACEDMDDEKVRWHPGDIVIHFPNYWYVPVTSERGINTV
jgi:hypothetical protein